MVKRNEDKEMSMGFHVIKNTKSKKKQADKIYK